MFERKEVWSPLPAKKIRPRIGLVVLGVSLLLAIFFIFVRPTLVGYSIYQQLQQANNTLEEYTQNYDQAKNELSFAKYNISFQSKINDQLEGQLQDLNRELIECLAEKNAAEALRKTNAEQANLLEQQEKNIQQLLDEKQKDRHAFLQEKEAALQELQKTCTQKELALQESLKTLQSQYDALLQNSARNICCKQKVDNSAINSYSVVNNKIVCGENSGTSLIC